MKKLIENVELFYIKFYFPEK